MTHGQAVRASILLIQQAGGRAWQRDVGLFYDRRGTPRRIGSPGEADVQGVLPGGRFVAVEVKTGTGRRTRQQVAYARTIERLGGLYVLARFGDGLDGAATIREALA